MLGFYYITFVGLLMLVSNLKEADSFAIQTNGKRELDFPDSAVTYLPNKALNHANITEEVDHNEEMMARLKRTTLTTTIDGKFTVHLIVSVKPAEQVFQPQTAKSGRLQTAERVHNPIPRNCENERCDFAMELELLKQVSTSVDPSVTQEETNNSRTTSEGQVKTVTPVAKTVSRFRTNRMHATTTRYPKLTPSIKQVLNRTKLTTETTTPYPTSISRPFNKQVFNRTRTGGRYQTTTTTRTPVNVTRISRIRSTGPASSNPLSWDSMEDYFFLERRNANAPIKSRAQQQQIRGKLPKAATKLFQSTRIQKKKEADSDVISNSTEKNEPVQTTTDGQIQLENVNHLDKQNVFNMTFDGPIFRNLVEQQNLSDDKVNVLLATRPPEEEVATKTTISNATLLLPVSLDDHIMSNVTQLDELNISMEPISIQNDSFVTQYSRLLDIPLESSADYTTTEQTLQNQTQTDAPPQATTSENPISANSEEPDIFPWEQIGDFEFQINPKSKQVVNIRILTMTTTTTSYNPLSISYEQQGNSSLSEGEGQQILDAEWETPATTSEIPAIVIPTQTVTSTVKLPIPLNRRKPIAVTQSDRDDTPLEPSKDIVPITATQMVVVDREQTVINDDTQTTTQNPEDFKLSGEEKQVVNGISETATSISVQQTTILDIPVKTEIIISADTVTSMEPIAEIIPTQSEPTAVIQPPIPINRKPMAGESNIDEKMSLEPVRELVPNTVTSVASDIPIQTTSTSPILELSEEFPWEQKHDYEVQINPKTKEIVNIRMLTSTTSNPPSSEVENDRTATPDSTHVDLTRTNESVLTAEEQDELTVEILGRILDRNGIIRKLVVPRPRDNIGERILVNHSGKLDDDFPGVKAGTRIAVTVPPKSATNNRDRTTHGRKPIFSHSSEDGVFYFRYANEEDELKHYRGNANNRNKQIITDDERGIDWNTRRDDIPQRESPYFYYSQDSNSSALVKSSCYIVLFIACVSVLFL